MSPRTFVAVASLSLGLASSLAGAARAELPAALKAGDARLVLNGAGARTKYLMQMYVAGLYLAEPSNDSAAIIAADAPMAMRLEITSGLVSQERLVESLNEGFHNATGGKPETLRKQIDEFRKCFAAEIAKGDAFDLVYAPGKGVAVVKNGKLQGAVEGLAFKRALFGIWLSDAPADKELKKSLLAAQGRSAVRR